MNINTSFLLQTLLPLTRIVLTILVIGFSYKAIASEQISNEQILRVAKIARDTGTNITIIKETTTVKVYGSSKKTNKKVKKTVLNFMKQKPGKWQKMTQVRARNFDFGRANPGLANKPPILDNQGADPVSTPVLDARDADNFL